MSTAYSENPLKIINYLWNFIRMQFHVNYEGFSHFRGACVFVSASFREIYCRLIFHFNQTVSILFPVMHIIFRKRKRQSGKKWGKNDVQWHFCFKVYHKHIAYHPNAFFIRWVWNKRSKINISEKLCRCGRIQGNKICKTIGKPYQGEQFFFHFWKFKLVKNWIFHRRSKNVWRHSGACEPQQFE